MSDVSVKAYKSDHDIWLQLQKHRKITQADVFRDGLAVWLARLNLESLQEVPDNADVSSVMKQDTKSLQKVQG